MKAGAIVSVASIATALAALAVPPAGAGPGSYAGLVCVGRLPGTKPSLIVCGARSRGFTAVRA